MNIRGLALGFLLSCTVAAFGQTFNGPDGCSVALKKDVIHTVRSANQQYAYLNVIDNSTFDELKKDGGASISVPIVDALLKASADYSDFQVKRTALFSQLGISQTEQQSENALSVMTNPIAYTYWSECMQTYYRTQGNGFYAWKSMENKDLLVIDYEFRPPYGVSDGTANGTVVGGSVDGANVGQLFPSGFKMTGNQKGTLSIHRDSSKPQVTAVIGVDGYNSITIQSSWTNQPTPTTKTATLLLQHAQTTQTVTGNVSTVGNTANNSNVPCQGGACSPDGRWQASVLNLVLNAPPGTHLSNPNLQCTSGPCGGWNSTTGPSVQAGGAQVDAQVVAWSLPTTWTLVADVVTPTVTTSQQTTNLIFDSPGTVSFEVPGDALAAVLNIKNGVNVLPISPGKDSSDGSLTYLTTVPFGTSTFYIYKAN